VGLLRPFGRLISAVSPRSYVKVRWKMKQLMGNPMGQLFLLPFLVREGDTVIDVGANTGQLTVPLARLVGENGVVHAFEPITTTYDILCETIESEGLRTMVVPHKLGLSDSRKTVAFTVPLERDTEATIVPHHEEAWADYETNKEKYRTEECEITTLDAFVKEHNVDDVKFIKCDVEGGELPVLKGARTVLENSNPPIIMLEVYEKWTKDYGYNPKELFGFLEDIAEYEFYWISKSGLQQVRPNDEVIPGVFYQWIDFICLVPDVHSKRLNVKRFLA